MFRMLPLRFQGLALPNPNIDILSSKITLLQGHWGTDSVTGQMLRQHYEVFQTEVGLSGNIFGHDYPTYSCLATHGFFKNYWQLCHEYGVQFQFVGLDIPLLRERDRSLMDAVIEFMDWSELEKVVIMLD